MRWCLCKNRYLDIGLCEVTAKELKRKELEVTLKEKEVNKKAEHLEKTIKELEKRSEHKAKKDLAAAAKLDRARNKLLKVLYSNKNFNKCEKCYKNKKKNRDKHSKRNSKSSKQAGLGILHNFFDKYFKMDKKLSNLMKINSQDFINTFKRILLQPYTNTCPSYKMSNNYGRRALTEPRNRRDPSFGDCYLMSLRKTPQLWIYHQLPWFYPHYLSVRAQYKNCGFLFMILFGFLLWIPCFICLGLCECLICCCCYDC